jgi:hypothetical protein
MAITEPRSASDGRGAADTHTEAWTSGEDRFRLQLPEDHARRKLRRLTQRLVNVGLELRADATMRSHPWLQGSLRSVDLLTG